MKNSSGKAPSNVLFVAPHEQSTGEAITALHMARALRSSGVTCNFLISPLCANLIKTQFPQHTSVFGRSRRENQSLWQSTLKRLDPDAIVFADYPLLFFSSGAVPVADDAWVFRLEQSQTALFTLDHLGYAQRRAPVFFGPPHLPIGVEIPAALPNGMQILLPCPTHEPNAALIGIPFRYWPIPEQLDDARRKAVRSRYVDGPDDLLVLHATPGWAHRLAKQMRLPHYRYLSQFLKHRFTGVGRRLTIVAVSDANVPASYDGLGIRFVSIPMLDPAEYEALIQVSDLVITDNAVSATMAKAVMSLTPCALLCNSYSLSELLEEENGVDVQWINAMENERPGSIFPFEVYPIWSRQDLDERGCCNINGYGQTFARVEWFGGNRSRQALQNLLIDLPTKAALKEKQLTYRRGIADLPNSAELFGV